MTTPSLRWIASFSLSDCQRTHLGVSSWDASDAHRAQANRKQAMQTMERLGGSEEARNGPECGQIQALQDRRRVFEVN